MPATPAHAAVPQEEEISVSYAEGASTSVTLHDGSSIQLHKLNSSWNPVDRDTAVKRLQQAQINEEILTGLLYIDKDSRDLHEVINSVNQPMNTLAKEVLCPGTAALMKINDGFR